MIGRNLDIALRIKADLEKAQAGLDRLAQSVGQLGTTTQTTSTAVGDTGRRVDELADQASRAAREVSGAGTRVRSFQQDTHRLGVSAGQTAQAMRQLPAQITDIITGLVSGQPAYMVAIQQGGQLRDSFGSAGGAMRGLASIITPTRLAIGGLTVVVAALAAGLVQGYLEAQRLESALISTGNYAGMTASELQGIADTLGANQGAYADASRAVQLLAESGRVTGAALDTAARSAVAFAQLTGQSIDDAVSKVVAISDRPVTAVRELDKQYHFLEASTYAQILALQRQGKETEAAALAQRAFADAMEDRRNRDVENLGSIQRAWLSLNNEIARGWDLIKGIGSQSINQQLDQLYLLRGAAETAGASGIPGFATIAKLRIASIDKQIAALKDQQQAEQEASRAESEHQQQQESGKAALDKIAAINTRYATEADRYAHTLADINKSFDDAIAAMPAKAAQLNAERARALRSAVDQYARSLLGDVKKPPSEPAASVRDSATASRELQAANDKLAASIDSLRTGTLGPAAQLWDEYAQAVRKAAEAGGEAISKGADVGQVQQQVAQAVDLATKMREAGLAKLADKDRAAFEKLRDSLNDVNGVSLGDVRAQIAELDKALAGKTITGDEYKATVESALNQRVTKLPTYQGIDAAVGGPFSELDKLNVQQANLQAAYAADLDLLNQQHDAKLRSDESFIARENQLYQEHARNLQAIDDARVQVMLLGISDSFSQAADAIKQGFGEQSAAYHAAFRLQKAAAIAMAIVNMQLDISQAAAKGFPANVPLIAKAIGEGLTILGNIRAASFAAGGYTGPGSKYQEAGVVHAEEFVNRREVVAQPGARPFLEDFNRVGMRALAWHLPGYADGGYVSPLSNAPQLPSPAVLRSASNGSGLIVSPVQVVVHASAGSTVESKQTTGSDGSQLLELAINAVANDMASGGKSAQAIERRYNIARKGNSYG